MDRIENYEVRECIGKGGFASVYRAISRSTAQEVAIKMVDKKQMNASGMASRVRQEVSIHSRLKHSAILELKSFFEDENYVYLVLELCERGELGKFLKQNATTFTEAETRVIIQQVVSGLLYLHSHGIMHRDLTLANLMLTRDFNIKIGDFGLATQVKNAQDKHVTMCGTPNFISPEVATRSSHGLEADIWGLGCLLYTMLVGTPPFDTTGVRSTLTKVVMADYRLPDHLSPEVSDLIESMLRKNPKERIKLKDIPSHPWCRTEEPMQQDSGMYTMTTTGYSTTSSTRPRTIQGGQMGTVPEYTEENEIQKYPETKQFHGGRENFLGTRSQPVIGRPGNWGVESSGPSSSTPALIQQSSSLRPWEQNRFNSRDLHPCSPPVKMRTDPQDLPAPLLSLKSKFPIFQQSQNLPSLPSTLPSLPSNLPSTCRDTNRSGVSTSQLSFHRQLSDPPPRSTVDIDQRSNLSEPSQMGFRSNSQGSLQEVISSQPSSLHSQFPGNQHQFSQQNVFRNNYQNRPNAFQRNPEGTGQNPPNSLQNPSINNQVNSYQNQPNSYPYQQNSYQNQKSFVRENQNQFQEGQPPLQNQTSQYHSTRGQQQDQQHQQQQHRPSSRNQEMKEKRRIEDFVAALSSLRLRPTRQKTKNAIANILGNGEVCLEFIKTRRGEERVIDVMRISQDGQRIIVYNPGGRSEGIGVASAPPPVPSGGADGFYSYSSLPEKLWKKYLYAARFVALVKAKTPKITLYTSKAKSYLMENETGDFESYFYTGGVKVSSMEENIKVIDVHGNTHNFRSDDLNGVPSTSTLYVQHFISCRQHCRSIESTFTASSIEKDDIPIFPLIIGRKPLLKTLEDSTNSSLEKENRMPLVNNLNSFKGTIMSTGLGGPATAVSVAESRYRQPLTGGHENRGRAGSRMSQRSDLSRTLKIQGVGVARLLEDGSVQVDYLDSTALVVKSKTSEVEYYQPNQDGTGVWTRCSSANLPGVVKERLAGIPAILQKLISTPPQGVER